MATGRATDLVRAAAERLDDARWAVVDVVAGHRRAVVAAAVAVVVSVATAAIAVVGGSGDPDTRQQTSSGAAAESVRCDAWVNDLVGSGELVNPGAGAGVMRSPCGGDAAAGAVAHAPLLVPSSAPATVEAGEMADPELAGRFELAFDGSASTSARASVFADQPAAAEILDRVDAGGWSLVVTSMDRHTGRHCADEGVPSPCVELEAVGVSGSERVEVGPVWVPAAGGFDTGVLCATSPLYCDDAGR